jgi:hypothetical protein
MPDAVTAEFERKRFTGFVGNVMIDNNRFTIKRKAKTHSQTHEPNV